jgi:hypothetical protein
MSTTKKQRVYPQMFLLETETVINFIFYKKYVEVNCQAQVWDTKKKRSLASFTSHIIGEVCCFHRLVHTLLIRTNLEITLHSAEFN